MRELRLIVPRFIQAMMRMNSMRIDDVKKLFGRILTKIYAFDFGDIEYDPETDTLSFNMISNLIKLFNRRLKAIFLKIQIDCEN